MVLICFRNTLYTPYLLTPLKKNLILKQRLRIHKSLKHLHNRISRWKTGKATVYFCFTFLPPIQISGFANLWHTCTCSKLTIEIPGQRLKSAFKVNNKNTKSF